VIVPDARQPAWRPWLKGAHRIFTVQAATSVASPRPTAPHSFLLLLLFLLLTSPRQSLSCPAPTTSLVLIRGRIQFALHFVAAMFPRSHPLQFRALVMARFPPSRVLRARRLLRHWDDWVGDPHQSADLSGIFSRPLATRQIRVPLAFVILGVR